MPRKFVGSSRLMATVWLLTVCMFTSRSLADYASAVLADNPSAYWRFNEAAGDVAMNAGSEGSDLDGEYFGGARVAANDFQLVDGRTVTGLGAGNLAFQVGDDIDEYVSIADPILSSVGEFSMTGWVNPGPRDGNRIGLFGQNDVIEFGFITPNRIQLWTPVGQVINYDIDPDNQIPEDTWFHVGVTGNGQGLALYVNGEFLAGPTGYGSSNFPFNIGGGGVYDPTGNQFTGAIDEVSIYNKALTEEQITAHFDAASNANGDYAATVIADGPTGYWRFNEGPDAAVNLGTAGAALNGSYEGVAPDADGPEGVFPGLGAGNKAIEVEAPDEGYVNVDASPLSNLSEFTLSGFVKPGQIFDNRVGLFGQNDAMEFGFINPNRIQMWTPSGGALNFDFADEVVEDEWAHLVAVGDGEEIRLYINGEFVGAGGSSLGGGGVDSYGDSAFGFNIGGGGVYDGTGNQFTGMIDEVALWYSALTADQIRAHFEAGLGSSLPGDFNNNGELDAGDLDELAVGMMMNDSAFDLDGDGDADLQDRLAWVNDLKGTWMGDSNLDGEFSSTDFVQVFQAGKFETGEVATWGEGDWNGDKEFSSTDFVLAFQEAGFEMGPRNVVANVPEPTSWLLFGIGMVALVSRMRRK